MVLILNCYRFVVPSFVRLIPMLPIMLLYGCLPDASHSDLRKFASEAYQNKAPKVEPLPNMEPYEGFVYAAEDEPEPFAAKNLLEKETKEKSPVYEKFQPERRREHLERFPLDGLAMVGAMFQETGAWALIGTADGGTHRVTLGNHLGQQNGKIIEINEQEVVLREVVRGPSGQWEERKATLALSQ